MYKDRQATIYAKTTSLVNGTQKTIYTLVGTYACDYWISRTVENTDDTTKKSGDPKYKEMVLFEETNLKRGDKASLSDQGGFDDGTYEVLDRIRYDRIDGTLDNIFYILKQIDG